MNQKRKTPALAATRQPGSAVKKHGQQPTQTRQQLKCPQCGHEGPKGMFAPGWPDELQMLATRFAHAGIGPDLATLGIVELYGLYLWLSRQGG